MIVILAQMTSLVNAYAPIDIEQDDKAKQLHRIDSLNILAYTFLLILMVCTIWLFKRRRARFLHETGLAIVYGLIIGAIIRYVGDSESYFSHLDVVPVPPAEGNNLSLPESPPDSVWVPLQIADKKAKPVEKTFVYVFRGQLSKESQGTANHDISQKATFDPEVK